MGSRSDSEEQFTMDTDYSPPNTLDIASLATLAALDAAEQIADQRADTAIASGGKKKGSKRRIISLNDNSDDSDVEITPQIQTSQPRRKSTFGTATRKPMTQSTIDGGIGSSSQACRKEKYVPKKAVIRGGIRKPLSRSQKGKGKVSATQSQKKKAVSQRKTIEELPELGDELFEEELDEDEIGEEEREERQRSDVWRDFKESVCMAFTLAWNQWVEKASSEV
ncbi:zinc finger BED domain-containing protein RICESLEEPER 2-like [Raphanus sativus]|nr:zinc finger BED domain-containing protein RICESLEEPER 2-like [Raphanus sativus]